MTAFLTVLAVLGWTLLALLVLAVLAFALPAWVLVDWRGGAWTLRARVLCVTVRLYPRPARKKREKTKKKRTEPAGPAAEKPPEAQQAPQEKAAPAGKPPKKKRRRLPLGKIADSLRTAGGFMRRVLRFVRVGDIELTLPVHDEDAALTAIRYGRVQASLGALTGVLRNLVRLDFKHVNIFADFDGVCENQASFSCKIGAPPAIIAIAAVWAYMRLTEAKVL